MATAPSASNIQYPTPSTQYLIPNTHHSIPRTQYQIPNTQHPTPNKNTPPESVDSCPHQQIIDLYHSNLPTLRRVKVWSDKRKKALRTRWREDTKHQSLEFWEKYFRYVSQSTFLIGNNTDWQADIEWLINPGNFVKVVEGKYHEQR